MSTTGKCMSMCPKKEFNFRKRHHLMHPLEFPGENVEDYEKVNIVVLLQYYTFFKATFHAGTSSKFKICNKNIKA